MDYLELRDNPNRPILKFFRSFFLLYLGFVSGVAVTIYLTEGRIEWTSAFLIFLALVFAGSRTLTIKSVTFTDHGIRFTNYLPFGGKSKTFQWDQMREVTLRKRVIEINNSVGSTEKVKLPHHTKEKGKQLHAILEQLSSEKAFIYNG